MDTKKQVFAVFEAFGNFAKFLTLVLVMGPEFSTTTVCRRFRTALLLKQNIQDMKQKTVPCESGPEMASGHSLTKEEN